MRIGIDISQLAHEGTGVGEFTLQLVKHLVEQNETNDYILFYSSMRKNFQSSVFNFESNSHVLVKKYKFPPTLLEFLWNRLHMFPIENLIGPIDIFISSDWVQPPTKAKKVTILYDVIVYKYPEETHNQTRFNLRNLILSPNIVASQKRRLQWVKKEVDKIICISEATKKDAENILHIPSEKLTVVYPGL